MGPYRTAVVAALISFFTSQGATAQTTFSTSHFTGILAAGSGVLQSLQPKTSTPFDFSPSDVFDKRNSNGNYHTGDLTLRYRVGSSPDWIDVDTAAHRTNLSSVPSSQPGVIQSSRVAAAAGGDLSIIRTWFEYEGDLALNFTLQNVRSDEAIEVGSVGFPLEFNTIFTGRSAVETREKCVLVDPFIGLDAGYVQVTRLLGVGPHLVVTPLGNLTKLEAWRFLPEPTNTSLRYQSQTFEGNYEWQVYTKAYSEQEWRAVVPWNEPTSLVLEPRQQVSFGLRFTTVASVDEIEGTVSSVGRPVAVGIPGYVLPKDLTGQVFINSASNVSSIEVYPRGALSITPMGESGGPWMRFGVSPSPDVFGRSRIEVVYDNGMRHSLHYYITESGPESLARLGRFLSERQWISNMSDPFGRIPSIITYDHSVNNYVLQENRTWLAGLSDDGGAGSFEAAAVKQTVQPVAPEIARLEDFVNKTVWANLQVTNGTDKYGVRRSLFFYEPDVVPGYSYNPSFNWTGTFNRTTAYRVDRAYNYVHVSALYWALYRAGRIAPGALSKQTPEWYLLQSYETVLFAFGTQPDGSNNTLYNDAGLMGETVWAELLNDLRAENFTSEATKLESIMKERSQYWSTQADPYGSEQAWDCTGQEGVYLWTKRFGYVGTVNKTIESIRGYMPTVAHWGWNGNARRYWDFETAGKYSRIERQIHHYGSGLNALPMLANYRASPSPSSPASFYDLRVGYGGHQGPLTNIRSDGFASMSFHSFPETLEWDPYSGDYGLSFLGHVLGAATYLVEHPTWSWLSFGGNVVSVSDDAITVQPRDSVRRRIYIAPLGLYVSIDAGAITEFTFHPQSSQLTLQLVDVISGTGAEPAPRAVVRYEKTADVPGAVDMKLASGATRKTQDGKGYVVEFKQVIQYD
ncbi:Uncharacterized protein T310_8146 [Rasamsonia emersonii CBS 393.64]|uniref:Glycoside hydrolase family 43 protein n=1 Tax=Rasamsonia emersonii (strain ATCC 16479 / CBS 393.64 / IMI 116815) TaxID=1408163 RepID=A0A0F4YI03_RASE3|nr:Uncharacterized protein T310_8146 [Rasamsonia emersonii CBS 393.64]KKA17917.1 Uncharacterized protein T310_8146 [Rasamsonia emersonii CBS 393.64]